MKMMMNKPAFAFQAAVSSLLILLILGLSPAHASMKWYTLGARQHTTHTRFENYPFQSGDISWQAGLEFHEGIGYWQLLLGYTPSPKNSSDPESEAPEIDEIFTPQLNLVLEDRGWLAGTGALANRIKTDVETDWSKIYWQIMVGYRFPFNSFDIEVMGIYPFDTWAGVSDFRFGDLEASIMLKRKF
jgi:hypothetical protein